MAKPILRLSNAEDVKALYPGGMKYTFYGITVELEGKPIGLGGIYFHRSWVLFAHITPELRKYKLTIWRTCKELMKAIKHLDQPVYAVADPSIPGSAFLLKKMGFTHLSKDWYGCQLEE
jgi:hypothetical protein